MVESHIVLGYRCNHRCKHCVVQEKRSVNEHNNIGDLTTDEACSAIQTALHNGAGKIVLTGGEPTLRTDISDLVSFCLKHNSSVQIQTNGSFSDQIKKICTENEDRLNKLEFMIPLHSSNKIENDMICGCKGGYDGTVESMKFLYEKSGVLIGKIVLTKYTGKLSEIIHMYESFGAKEVIIAYPHCVSFPLNKVYEIDLQKSETRKILDELYREKINIPIVLQAFPRCFIGKNQNACIQEEMEEFLSLEIVENKFRADSGNMWHEYRKMDKLKFLNCEKCMHNAKCEGIWKEYIKAYGKE